MKLKALAASVAMTAGFALTGPAQAAGLLIDDWNINVGSGSTINAVLGSNPITAARTAVGGNSLPRGNIFAEITTPSPPSTASGINIGDCDSCLAGVFSNNTGTFGFGYWSWNGGGNLTAYDKISFSYRADLTGADVIVSFFSGGALQALVQQSDIVSTGGAFNDFSLALPAGLTGIDTVYLHVFTNGGAFNAPLLGALNLGIAQDDIDFRIRNLQVTNGAPEPGTLALLGLGLAGVGALRRRLR